jgi:hypothetical protein
MAPTTERNPKIPARKCNTSNSTFFHGPGKELSNANDFFPPRIQPKLSVGNPDDPYEKEADEMADKVVPGAVEENVLQTKGNGTPEITPSFEQELQRSKGGGSPLPDNTRLHMENTMGADFSRVQIHNNAGAVQLSRSIQAQAFTHGRDIYFNEGKYSPDTDSGQHLLAHELTHTIQQGGVQRKPDVQRENEQKAFPIKIPPGTTSKQEFRRYAELQLFNQIVNLKWASNSGTEKIYEDISKHAGETITFRISADEIKKYRVEKKNNAALDKDYNQLDSDSKKGINEAIDERYYESTHIDQGTPIKAGEKGRTDMWDDFKKQVMEQRKRLNDLPPAVKTLLQSDQTFTPENYAKLSVIAALLKEFTAADFLDYKSKINAETTDLDVLQKSMEAYLKEKAVRNNAGKEREIIKTKLYGLKELYIRYKEFRKYEGSYKSINAADESVVRNTNRDHAEKGENDQRAALSASLKAHNFNTLEEFGAYVAQYEAAFRKETIAIANDHLQRYRHVLFEEEKKLTDDAHVTKLFTEISRSGAKQHYEKASDKSQEAVMAPGLKETIPQQATLHRQMDLNREAGAARTAGDNAMQQLPSASPLMKEKTFKNNELSKVNSKEELKRLLKAYIDKKKESIVEAWTDITTHEARIYELDDLVTVSKKLQGITDDSIYDLIIGDKISELGREKILSAVCGIIIGIALAIASFSTGVPALLATGGSLVLSGYAVYEEIEKYKNDSNAYDVDLLTKEPSMTWVVMAIVGAGLDMAALGAAFKAAGPIAKATKAFNETNDVITLEKALAQIADVDAKIRRNIVAAAKEKAALKASLDSMLEVGSRLNTLGGGGDAIQRLAVFAYRGIKTGERTFESFMQKLQLKKIAKEASQLSDEELNVFKVVFEKALKSTEEEIKAAEKVIERVDLTAENRKVALELMEDVRSSGKFSKAGGKNRKYHGDTGHGYPDELVQDIMTHPEAIYETRNGEKLIYLKDGDIVVVKSTKSAKGDVVTAYGKSGVKGKSGATVLGGSPTDPGEPVTDLIITEGRIPAKNGFIAPAKKIYP